MQNFQMNKLNNTDKTNISLLTNRTVIPKEQEIKAYKRRWIILVIYMIYAGVCSMQWIEYSIINNVVTKYYNVSSTTVDWTSIILMLLYAPLAVPASFILDKMGLRVSALGGSILSAAGTFIKVFSINQDRFWVVLLGQGMIGIAQSLIFCLPTRLATVWFKSNEVSTASSLGIFGTLLGIAFGFLLPPIIVQNSDDMDTIASGLQWLCWSYTAAAVLAAVAVVFYFPKQPINPPSAIQLQERNSGIVVSYKLFFESLLSLWKNNAFVVHTIAHGINAGVFCTVSTLLNQFVMEYFSHFDDAEEFAGRSGLVLIVVGMGGSVIFGFFLDKTHKYKETTLFTYFMTGATVVGLMYALELQSKIFVYVVISLFGFFSNAYLPVSFEFAIELTFPITESTTTNILSAPSQILGAIFSLYMGKLTTKIGSFWALSSQAILLAIGTVITCFIPNRLQRQEALKQCTENIKSIADEKC